MTEQRPETKTQTITYEDGSELTITLHWCEQLGRYVTVPDSDSEVTE